MRWPQIGIDRKKRGKSLIEFSSLVKELIVIGVPPDWASSKNVPDNINFVGYVSDYKILSEMLSTCDGLFNPSYRDAAPKTVSQAISIGIPVLYSNTGGISEIVGNCGEPISDYEYFTGQEVIPLSFDEIKSSLKKMENNWLEYIERAYVRDNVKEYSNMLKIYEEAIKNVLSNSR